MNGNPETCGPEGNNLEHLDIPVQSNPPSKSSPLLDQLIAGAAKASVQHEEPVAGLYFRPMHFPEIGSTVSGHAHKYDHVTLVVSGSILARFFAIGDDGFAVGEERDADGAVTKQATAVREQVYGKGARILIKKNMAHEFTALEPDTQALCVFALRDADGNITHVENNDWVAESAA